MKFPPGSKALDVPGMGRPTSAHLERIARSARGGAHQGLWGTLPALQPPVLAAAGATVGGQREQAAPTRPK